MTSASRDPSPSDPGEGGWSAMAYWLLKSDRTIGPGPSKSRAATAQSGPASATSRPRNTCAPCTGRAGVLLPHRQGARDRRHRRGHRGSAPGFDRLRLVRRGRRRRRAAADAGRPRSSQGGRAPRRHGPGQAAAPVGPTSHGRRVASRLPDGRPRVRTSARLVPAPPGAHGLAHDESPRPDPTARAASSVNIVTHCRQEHGIFVMSVPQNMRAGPNAS